LVVLEPVEVGREEVATAGVAKAGVAKREVAREVIAAVTEMQNTTGVDLQSFEQPHIDIAVQKS
jgi:hypothetical protein